MKRIAFLALACVMAFTAVFAHAAPTARYVDDETGISFDVPAGWVELPDSTNNPVIKVQYTPMGYVSMCGITLVVMDYYGEMYPYLSGVDRADVDFSYFTAEVEAEMVYTFHAYHTEYRTFAGTEYCMADCDMERTYGGLSFTFKCRTAFTIENGYLFMLQYINVNDLGENLTVYEDLLESVRFGK